MFMAILTVKLEAESTSAVEQDGRFITTRLAYDIARASSILQPAGVGSSSGTLSLLINGNTFTYMLSGNNLVLTNNTGTSNLNSSESTIPSLQFTNLGSNGGKNTIRVVVTVNGMAQKNGPAASQAFTITVGRRN
jgi:hypothetical protein